MGNIQQIKWNISMTSFLTFSILLVMLSFLLHFLDPLWMANILFDLNMYARFSSISKLVNWVISDPMVHKHCVKSVQIRSFFLVHIFPYSVRMRENTDQENSVFGHFSHSERFEKLKIFSRLHYDFFF